jgi:hypothetical protein
MGVLLGRWSVEHVPPPAAPDCDRYPQRLLLGLRRLPRDRITAVATLPPGDLTRAIHVPPEDRRLLHNGDSGDGLSRLPSPAGGSRSSGQGETSGRGKQHSWTSLMSEDTLLTVHDVFFLDKIVRISVDVARHPRCTTSPSRPPHPVCKRLMVLRHSDGIQRPPHQGAGGTARSRTTRPSATRAATSSSSAPETDGAGRVRDRGAGAHSAMSPVMRWRWTTCWPPTCPL